MSSQILFSACVDLFPAALYFYLIVLWIKLILVFISVEIYYMNSPVLLYESLSKNMGCVV
jgi:hypothetical protein